MSDEMLLPLLESAMAKRFGRPVDQLYTQAAGPRPDPALRRAVEWHHRLVHTDAHLKRCEDALLPHLAQGEDLTGRQEQRMAEAAERVTAASHARDAVALTLRQIITPPPTGHRPAAPGARGTAAARATSPTSPGAAVAPRTRSAANVSGPQPAGPLPEAADRPRRQR